MMKERDAGLPCMVDCQQMGWYMNKVELVVPTSALSV